MIVSSIWGIPIIFFLVFCPSSSISSKEVTVDINKDANNPRKRHFIANKDIVSLAPKGFTEHIYEQDDPFDVSNVFFGRKKLESGFQELSPKGVEKVGVIWKFETPILLYFKYCQSPNKTTFVYYKLNKQKSWTLVELTDEQLKSLPLSGRDLESLLNGILEEVGDLPEDRPLTGVGSFKSFFVLLPLLISLTQCFFSF